MATNGLDDVTWDSTSARLRFGITSAPCTKFDRPKVERKREKVLRVGEELASKRTPGIVDIGDVSAEMLATDWVSVVLPRMPAQGWAGIEFTVTLVRKHPSVTGLYSILMDRCSIVSSEESVGADEKGAIVKFSLSVMNVFERGADGIWKCMARLPKSTSAQGAALMTF